MRWVSTLLLAVQLFNSETSSNILNDPSHTINSLDGKLSDYSLNFPPEISRENEELLDDENVWKNLNDIIDRDLPVIQSFQDKTELRFRKPIDSVNVDYARNVIVLRFQGNKPGSIMESNSIENEEKKSLHDDFIPFGKRTAEEFPMSNRCTEDCGDKKNDMRLDRGYQTPRDARGDNFMRFGRLASVKKDFMRVGRATNDFMRFGRNAASDNFSRLGRARSEDFMRFGRTTNQDFMRFGRTANPNFMRFGRTPVRDFIRFMSTHPSLVSAGQEDFMRFRRTPHTNFMRFGRNTLKIPLNRNFMRYSTPPQTSDNFMRFGKSIEKSDNKSNSQPSIGNNELKLTAKLIHEADKNDGIENRDKTVRVILDQHQKQATNNKVRDEEPNLESLHQRNIDNGLDSDMYYYLKGLE